MSLETPSRTSRLRLTARSRHLLQASLVVGVNAGALALLVRGIRAQWFQGRPRVAPVMPVHSNESDFDARHLAKSRIFGAAPDEREDNEMESPLSALRLVLRGIVSLDRGGVALISVGGREAKPYPVGEPIVAGAVLEALYSDRIVVRRGAETATVMLAGPRITRKIVDQMPDRARP